MSIIKVIESDKKLLIVEYEDGSKEKRTDGTVAWRCNNPGNLKIGSFARSMGAIGSDKGGHAVFPTYEMGWQAHYTLLFNEESPYYRLTLLDAMKRYAPEYDGNNPTQYQRFITKKTGVDANRVFKTLTNDEKIGIVECMQIFEGYKEGNVSQYNERSVLTSEPKTKKPIRKPNRKTSNTDWKNTVFGNDS